MRDRDEIGAAGAKKAPGLERNVYKFIERWVRPRLENYLGGTRSIEKLHVFLAGYQAALAVNHVRERDCPPFELFLFWLVETRPGAWSTGWAYQLLQEAGGDTEVALDKFFNLISEFGSLREVEGEYVELGSGHQRPPNAIDEAFVSLGCSRRPVPTRIQLVYLRPGSCCYCRETFAAEPREQLFLFRDATAAKESLRIDLGVGPDGWHL